MDNPLISVIMPSYNAEKYLQRSIESIINQTYENWEFLIVDDGSTDNSISICRDYEKRDSRIKLICNQHGGTAIARNTALEIAKGDYIAFLDADDAYHSIFLESMLNEMLLKKCDLAICNLHRGTDIESFLKGDIKPCFSIVDSNELIRQIYQGEWINIITSSAKVYSKEIAKNIHYPEGHFFEDVFVMHKPVFESGRICRTKEKLYFYNITPNSSSKTQKSIELLDREKAIRSHWEFYLKKNRQDLVVISIQFYLIELISIYHRIQGSDRPQDCRMIRMQFEEIYKMYRKKIKFTTTQKDQILAFRYPHLYDIRNMLRNDGVLEIIKGFIVRKFK